MVTRTLFLHVVPAPRAVTLGITHARRDARVATESETITDAHPAAQNPIESVPQPQHGLAANQDSPGHIPLNASPAVRQAERFGSIDVANRRHIELDAGSL